MLDKINNKDVPYDKVPWWIDVQENQSIEVSGMTDLDAITNQILQGIGMHSYEDKMNQLIENYKKLFDVGRHEEADRYLTEYLHGQSLAGKAKIMANIMRNDVVEIVTKSFTEAKKQLDKTLINHVGQQMNSFFECHQLILGDQIFTFGNTFLFHRGNRGDAHVISVWRNQEHIYTIGGLVDATDLQVYYDRHDDVIYVCYRSNKEEMKDGELLETWYQNVTTIEEPLGDAICNDFKEIRI